MKVITPIDITDSNMDNSIAEPDVSLGEVEWDVLPSVVTTPHELVSFDIGGGFLWALPQAGSILYKYTERFEYIEQFDISAIVGNPQSITYANGYIFIVNRSDNVIYKFTALGAYTGDSFSVSAETSEAGMIVWDGNFLNLFDRSALVKDVFKYTVTGLYVGSWTLPWVDNVQVIGADSDINNLYILTTSVIGRRILSTVSLDEYSELSFFSIIGSTAGCAIRSDRILTADDFNVREFSKSGGEGVGYVAGDQRIKSLSHANYECVSFSNEDPEIGAAKTPPTWIEVGPTNRYAAFDYAINTKSILPISGAEFIFTPNSKCTTVSLYGLEDVTRVYVEVRENNASGDPIYPIGAQTGYRDTAIDEPFGDFISNDEQFLSDKVIFDDLPIYSTPYIKVTFESNVSEIKVGDIVIGNPRSLGVVNYQSSTSRTSYDTVKTDIFGNEKITSRPSAEYTSFELTVDAVYADYVERILKDSLNKPRVWIGEKAGGEKLFTFGYYERSPIVYSSPTKYDTSLKIRGLV